MIHDLDPAGDLDRGLGWFSLSLAFASTLIILIYIALHRHRQHMRIMNAVYPITALYGGPVALWFYLRHGRDARRHHVSNQGVTM